MATATNFLLLKPNLLKWNHYPRYPIIQPSIKNSFIPLKINSNFKALSVKTGFSPCKLKENPFEILAKRFVKSLESFRLPVVVALVVGLVFYLIDPTFFRPLFIVGAIAIMCCLIAIFDGSTSTNSVYKLQVGLLGLKSCSLKKDLNCIAETADTSTSEGLQYVLTEATLALLRHSYSGIYYASSFGVKESTDEVEKRFKQLSIEEHGKFDEATLVNLNNINKKKRRSTKLRTSTTGISNEYVVVTMLVAANGVHNDLPCIKNSKDLKDALLKLATIPYSRTILAVEVLWTPQYEDDTPSEEEFLEDYPLMKLNHSSCSSFSIEALPSILF